MARPYIAEVQTGQWMSDQIRDSFKTVGFVVRDWPLTQHLEKQLPADRIFFSPDMSKLFGLQYKTRYGNSQDFWPLDATQHRTLRKYPWIFYCCSELTDVADHGLALHRARLYRPRFEFQSELPVSSVMFRGGRPYFRWGSFYRDLKACRIGARVRSQDDLRGLLGPLSGEARQREANHIRELFLADFDNRILFTERTF